MQKLLYDNDTLIYSTHNEGKSVVAERFIKTLKDKTYTKLPANDSKSCLDYLNKLVDQYNNVCHRSIGMRTIDADYSALTEEIELSQKAPKLNVGDRVRTTK